MPRVPLPQIGLQTGTSPSYDAPGGAPLPDVSGRQVAQLGQAQAEFGQGVAAAARVMQDQQDDNRVTEGFTKWADRVSSVLSGENGYLYTEGKNAQGYYRAKALGEIEKSWREIEAGLENDVQRGMFREAVRKHMVGVKERVYGHEAEQVRIDGIGQADAMRVQAARTAVESFVNRALNENAKVSAAAAESLATGKMQGPQGQEPQSLRGKTYAQAQAEASDFDVQRNTAIGQANRVADLKGWKKNDPRRQELVLQTTTAIHMGIVEQLIGKGKTQQAKDYVAKLDERQVSPDKLADMNAAVRRAGVNDNGATLAAEIVRSTDMAIMPKIAKQQNRAVPNYEVFGGEAYQLGVAEIEKRFSRGTIDADERRVALAEFEATHNRRRQMWADRTRETQEEAERLFNADPNLTLDSPAFPPQLRNDLEKYGRLDEASKFQGGLRRVTTPRAYADVMKALDAGRLRGMSYSDLYNEFYSKLGPSEWDELKQFHAAANTNKPVPHTSVFSDADRMKKVAAGNKVIKSVAGPKGEVEELRYAQFAMEVQNRINILESKGIKVDDDKLQAIADAVVLEPKVSVEEWGTDPEKWEWELTPEEEKVAYRTEWGEEMRVAKGKGDEAANILKLFNDAGAARPSTTQVAWLASKIPAADATRIFNVIRSRGVTPTADMMRSIYLQFYAPKPEPEQVPIWKQQGYSSELRWRAGQRYPR